MTSHRDQTGSRIGMWIFLFTEIPDPLTDISYGPYAVISPDIAGDRGIAQGDIVRFDGEFGLMELPAVFGRGIAAGTIVVPVEFSKCFTLPADPITGEWCLSLHHVTTTRTGLKIRLPVLSGATATGGRGLLPEATHHTLYPPPEHKDYRWGFASYFVAGAIFSGTAMVITLTVPMRKILGIRSYITVDHYENIAKILLVTSLIVTFSYIVELALAFYSGNLFEITVFKYRMFGDYKYFYWLMTLCNVVLPLTLFVRKLRRSIGYLFGLSLLVNVGMWLERFIIIVTSLAKEFNPYSWGTYSPSLVEIGISIGSFGMFFTFFLIFSKVLPVLSMAEIKEERS